MLISPLVYCAMLLPLVFLLYLFLAPDHRRTARAIVVAATALVILVISAHAAGAANPKRHDYPTTRAGAILALHDWPNGECWVAKKRVQDTFVLGAPTVIHCR